MPFDIIKQERETNIDFSSYYKVSIEKQENLWKQLKLVTVSMALSEWLQTLNTLTAKSYGSGLKKLVQKKLILPELSLQSFSLVNHERVIDEIKLQKEWLEATRQARAAAYISFTGFLQRRTQGMIKKAVASKEGASKTFYKIREKVKTSALSKEQTKLFFFEISNINTRDALIAKLILQGGKRKEEVLSLMIDHIDFTNKIIFFKQTKTRGLEKITAINFPENVMVELKNYIDCRKGFVFITKNGRRLSTFQIDRNFLKAGERAGIPFRITPHVLRVTLVTRLKELKVQDTDIMKITGHVNPAQLSSYDKSDLADNASAKYHFV